MHSVTSALDGSEWLASLSGRFTPRERAPGTHWIGGWVDGFTVSEGNSKSEQATGPNLLKVHQQEIFRTTILEHGNLPLDNEGHSQPLSTFSSKCST
jgi:hypothetical protein